MNKNTIIFLLIAMSPVFFAPFIDFGLALAVPVILLAIWVGSHLAIAYKNNKRGNQDAILYPPSDNLPDILIDVDAELYLLGFKQIGWFKRTKTAEATWTYLHDEGEIVAYVIATAHAPYVNVCAYLEDGFAINVDYNGAHTEDTASSIRRIVDTDLDTAFDYLEHLISQYEAQHGQPKTFKDLRDILDWEDQFSMIQDSFDTFMTRMKSVGVRLLIMLILMVVAGYSTNFVFAEFNLLVFVGIVLTVFGGIIWAVRPLAKDDSVEARKAKELG